MWTLGRSYDKEKLGYGEEQTGEVEDYNEWDEYGEANQEDIWRWDEGERSRWKRTDNLNDHIMHLTYILSTIITLLY